MSIKPSNITSSYLSAYTTQALTYSEIIIGTAQDERDYDYTFANGYMNGESVTIECCFNTLFTEGVR